MKINSTDYTYCKITDVEISGSIAKVSLLAYSSAPQNSTDSNGSINRAFCFYLRDLDTGELIKLSNNIYWVDRYTSTDNTGNNIDINMYKKIILTVDISNRNNAQMLGSRWVRHCDLVLANAITGEFTTTVDGVTTPIWEHKDILFISSKIVLPTLSEIKVSKDTSDKITISIDSYYESQEDFNYINNNIKINFIIKSVYTNLVLEKASYYMGDIQKHQEEVLSETFTKSYNEPILVEIQLTNLKNEILLYKNKFINPEHSLSNLYIKTDKGVKAVIAASVKTASGIKSVASLTVKK